MTTSIHDIQLAAEDENLRARFETAALEAGMSRQWAWDRMVELAAHVIAGSNPAQTIADTYVFAKGTYEVAVAALPAPPGKNPSAVLDSYIRDAVTAVKSAHP